VACLITSEHIVRALVVARHHKMEGRAAPSPASPLHLSILRQNLSLHSDGSHFV